MQIKHNLLAMNADRQVGINNKKGEKLSERLSSGYKINRAADDAAGLAISEKMRRVIRGLNQASLNVSDGISFVQTAEGALNEVHDMVQRLNELSVKAVNGTNTDEDREYIDAEVSQIKEEMDRVFKTTSFNGRKIWGDKGNNPILIGMSKDYAVTMNTPQVKSTITEVNKWAVPRSNYQLAANADGIVVSWTGYDGNLYESDVIPWDDKDDIAGQHSFELKDHMDLTKYPGAAGLNFKYTYNVNDYATFDDMVNSLNGKYVGSYPTTYEEVEKYGSSSKTSFNVSINYDSILKSDCNVDISDDDFIENTDTKGTDNNIISNPMTGSSNDPWEFEFDMKNIGKVTTEVSSVRYYGGSFQDPADQDIWWKWQTRADGSRYQDTIWHTPSPDNGSMDSVINALNGDVAAGRPGLQGENNGGRVWVSYVLKDSGGNSIGSMSMYISVNPQDTADTIKNDLAKLTGIDITSYKPHRPGTDDVPQNNYSGSVRIDVPEYKYEYALEIQAGCEAEDIIEIAYEGLNTATLGIRDLDVKTADGAKVFLAQVDKVLNVISAQRSDFGAYQNRLEHAKRIDDNSAENTQAAESIIRDADMESLLVEFSINQILMQAGQAMLTNANKTPERVLSLLQ